MYTDDQGVLHYDLIINQGEDYDRAIPATDTATGGPATIEGWTIRGQIRADYGDDSPVLHELDVAAVDTDVILSVPGDTSALWPWRLARYDVKLTAPNTKAKRFLEGAVVVRAQITRD